MKKLLMAVIVAMLASPALLAVAENDDVYGNGDVREHNSQLQVWSEQRQRWVKPPLFFADDLKSLNGPTYGRTSSYPPYAKVKEWETLVDLLPDGRECPMVFFHNRWRRLADVRALDDRLRNFGGCRDVFKY
ncbi:MAG: hypothetical protein OIF57_00095 [Marinobacterium sp.]|nr:hypothetical protein [Marinobacterium sp.]